MKRLKPTVLAYLAGVLDSDGYIGITRSQYRPQRWTYWERVQVDQCDRQAMQLFQQTFGGSIRGYVRQNRRIMFTWGYSGKPARQCLLLLLPWLRIKKSQAIEVLRLRSIVEAGKAYSWTRGQTGRGHAMRPLSISRQLERLHRKVQRLKHPEVQTHATLHELLKKRKETV